MPRDLFFTYHLLTISSTCSQVSRIWSYRYRFLLPEEDPHLVQSVH
ncbi:MAG: hypothetical protein ACI9E1_001650, partial [Cryomorphaceae bacterium]